MGGNRPSELFIMIIIASGVILGIISFQADLFENYSVDIPEEYSYLYEAGNATEDITQIKEAIDETEIFGIEPLDMFIGGVYRSLQAIFGLGNVYTAFVSNMASILNIPAFAVGIAIAAITTVILFGVIQMIVKFKG
jgi:hypothetical protein